MPDLTDNEIRALLYFVVGVAAGRGDRAYRLHFSGDELRRDDGRVELVPESNRAYSIGTLGSELSWSGGVLARQLVEATYQWARTRYPASASGARVFDAGMLGAQQRAQAVADLSRNGEQIRADHGRDVGPRVKEFLVDFLASHAGQAFVHAHDVERVEQLMTDVVAPLRSTGLYQQAQADNRNMLVVIVTYACLYNQALAETLVQDIRDGILCSTLDVSDRVGQTELELLPSLIVALPGIMVFSVLQRAQVGHPLREPWRRIVANPLINHQLAGSDTAAPHMAQEYRAIRNAFAFPSRGWMMLRALDEGGSYADGDPSVAGKQGCYAAAGDFLTWDRSGKGHAFVKGQWRDFELADMSLAINANGTRDLHLHRQGHHEVLLHLPGTRNGHAGAQSEQPEQVQHPGTLREHDRGSQARALQIQLAELGYRAVDGGWLIRDGNFESNTRAALEAFQQDRRLEVDGIAGRDTFVAIHRAMQERIRRPLADPSHPGNYMYNRALGALQESDVWQESEERTARLAARATIVARAGGFTTIDRVAFDASGTTAYFEQGDHQSPLRRHVEVDVRHALRVPAAGMGSEWYRAEQYQAALAAAAVQALQPPQLP